ncbi:hypothetical protein ESB00_07920 [Oleiharenicola lentus]|jgi:hypothetical protein|uniref:Uncharacterized protein n=1 Tax=Oleiharenicola lentus TaxID=2508720 RepID=A0A4Q1CA87_9BACT|nr:hypothetical protein [Oleiharenicola lentus]RXK55800.1 hypothetical protein ESB00_07920 [Oleiharenicola lentus]
MSETNQTDAFQLNGVRYSLPQLLREVKLEREAPAFAMEKLDQVEIGKLFSKKRPRRALKAEK